MFLVARIPRHSINDITIPFRLLWRLLLRSSSSSNISSSSSLPKSENYVDRMKYQMSLKDDDATCVAAFDHGQFVFYYKNRIFVRREQNLPPGALWLPYEDVQHVHSKMNERINLRRDSVLIDVPRSGLARFGLQLYPIEEDKLEFVEQMFGGRFEELRFMIPFLHREEAALYTRGRSVLYWHRKNQFCSNCGKKSERNFAGNRRVCMSCRTVHWPSLSPVIMVLVSDKHRCLLVRQPQHTTGMYSAIAGYMEPGEIPEDAVRREVAEEVGLELEDIQYLCGQHWPFPMSSLMLGFMATSNSDRKLDLDTQELEDARWFDVQTVKSAMALVQQNPTVAFVPQKNRLLIPPPGPIAFYLIEEWVKKCNN